MSTFAKYRAAKMPHPHPLRVLDCKTIDDMTCGDRWRAQLKQYSEDAAPKLSTKEEVAALADHLQADIPCLSSESSEHDSDDAPAGCAEGTPDDSKLECGTGYEYDHFEEDNAAEQEHPEPVVEDSLVQAIGNHQEEVAAQRPCLPGGIPDTPKSWQAAPAHVPDTSDDARLAAELQDEEFQVALRSGAGSSSGAASASTTAAVMADSSAALHTSPQRAQVGKCKRKRCPFKAFRSSSDSQSS